MDPIADKYYRASNIDHCHQNADVNSESVGNSLTLAIVCNIFMEWDRMRIQFSSHCISIVIKAGKISACRYFGEGLKFKYFYMWKWKAQ